MLRGNLFSYCRMGPGERILGKPTPALPRGDDQVNAGAKRRGLRFRAVAPPAGNDGPNMNVKRASSDADAIPPPGDSGAGRRHRGLSDVSIGTQLRVGLGLILVLVIALGVLAWIETNRLWQQTSNLYLHPVQIRRSIGKLETGMLNMLLHERDMFLARTNQEAATALLRQMEGEKDGTMRQFTLLNEHFLGPRDDLTALNSQFTKWDLIYDETIRLLREDRTAEVETRLAPGGIQHAQAEIVRSWLERIDDRARDQAEQFYQVAKHQNDSINRQLALFVSVILGLSWLVGWALMAQIKRPMAELVAVTEQFRSGNLRARSRYDSANEFGALSTSFNGMADRIQTEMEISESSTHLARVMLREEAADKFCRELLKELLQRTGSQVGAVYFLNESKTAFEHFQSIGLGARARPAFSATDLEGELGVTLATGQIQRTTNIPAQTRFAFIAVSGEFTPREIMTIPVVSGDTVSAVISLASVRGYDASSVRLVNDTWSVLTARMNGVLAFRKIQGLVNDLENQNRAIQSHQRVLAEQASTLMAQNSELEMQKRQLNEANRLKSAFLSNMSHEVRTPLNSVIVLSGVLNRRLANLIPAEEYGYLGVIERNGKHLLSLINDILDLSRIEAGREEVSVSPFSVGELADEIVAMIGPQARERGLTLRSLVPTDLPPLTSDPDKCRHILQNLVGNAVKFTEQGQVSITAELTASAQRPEFLISVADTGIGIAADALHYIFDEFRQADDSTSRKYGGTGLGLAIAKRYALLLQGDITVESTPGKGSTFTLRLPQAARWPQAAPAVESGTGPAEGPAGRTPATVGLGRRILAVADNDSAIREPSPGAIESPPTRRRGARPGKPLVLVVEDNADNRRTVRALLKDHYQILEAEDGRAGLEQARRHQPDIVLMDIALPILNGWQALEAMRQDGKLRHIPVIALTAKAMSGDRQTVLANGFDGYLSKPIDDTTLRRTLQEILDREPL